MCSGQMEKKGLWSHEHDVTSWTHDQQSGDGDKYAFATALSIILQDMVLKFIRMKKKNCRKLDSSGYSSHTMGTR